jgi:hypothetical protein
MPFRRACQEDCWGRYCFKSSMQQGTSCKGDFITGDVLLLEGGLFQWPIITCPTVAY